MPDDVIPTVGTRVGGTILACVATPVVLVVVAAVAGGFWALFNSLMTVIRPGIIGFFAAIIGGIAGTYAARAVNDAIFKFYHKRVVFVEVALLCIAGLAFEATLPMETGRITPVAQCIAIIVCAWPLFWVGEAI